MISLRGRQGPSISSLQDDEETSASRYLQNTAAHNETEQCRKQQRQPGGRDGKSLLGGRRKKNNQHCSVIWRGSKHTARKQSNTQPGHMISHCEIWGGSKLADTAVSSTSGSDYT